MRLLDPFAFFSRAHARLLGVGLALLVLSGPVLAEDTPFQMESSSWMSFDRYKEKPAAWVAPDERAAEARIPVVAPPPVTPASMPTITAPTRPVMPPVMPGLNKDFDVRVDSTEDDQAKPAAETADAVDPDALDTLQSKQWQDAAEAARHNKDKKQVLDDEDHPPFDIRLSYLPSRITPIPNSGVKKPEPKVAVGTRSKIAPPPAVAAANTPPPAVSKPADAAACAAIDAYKKRQLAAIESDRKTLTALQDAIAQLGLGKQLDFMTGAAGNLNAQQPGSTANIDTPASANGKLANN